MTDTPLKTRWLILEPEQPFRDIRTAFDLASWQPVQFRKAEPTLREIRNVVDPIFPGVGPAFDHVKVNFWRGQADMFVGDHSADGAQPLNETATLIYWTATIMHKIDAEAGKRLPTYQAMWTEAIRVGAGALKGEGLASGLYRDTPRVYGRAVLFEDQVWF
jgi:hypothetical protein